MRFITEFELEYSKPIEVEVIRFPDVYKMKREFKMGEDIGKSFGWDKKDSEEKVKYKLEIEAFPVDKWIEFKNKLFTELENSNANGIAILQMIKDLEFYGTPAIKIT